MKKIVRFLSLAFIILVCVTIPSSKVFADQEVHSIIGDLANGTLTKTKLSDSNIFGGKADREKKTEIANNGGNASLFDRFGDNINFVGYLGEMNIQISLIDKIYTIAISQPRSPGAIADALSMLLNEVDAGVNNVVYKNRVDIQNDNVDPRYRAFKSGIINSTLVGKYNIRFVFAKYACAIQRLFISDTFKDLIMDGYNLIFSSAVFDQVKKVILSIMSVIVIIFVIRFTIVVIQVIRKGGASIVWKIIGNAFIAMMVIIAFGAVPLNFQDIYQKYDDNIQDVLLGNLADATIDNEVISGSEDVIDATLFYICTFDPWCQGMFGRNYEDCYLETDSRCRDPYPISNEDIGSASKDNPKSSCLQTIGNINVNSSDGTVQNIAALAYSCQSIYHIDTDHGVGSDIWPNAQTTVYNDKFYNDDFKWVDAMMNISCEYIGSNDTTGSLPKYGDTAVRSYTCKFMRAAGYLALYRTIFLLLPLTIASIYSLVLFFKMVLCFFMMAVNSFKFLMDPENNYILPHLKKFVTTALDYLFSVLVKGVLYVFFCQLYDSFLGNVIFFIVAIIFFFGSTTLTNSTKRIKARIRRAFEDWKNNVQKKIEEEEEAKEKQDEIDEHQQDDDDESDNKDSDDNDSDDENNSEDNDSDDEDDSDEDNNNDFKDSDDSDDSDDDDSSDDSNSDDSDKSDKESKNDKE